MTPAAFAVLTAVVAVAALTPGPAVTAIVARAIADGPRSALAINAGIVTGDLIFFALAAAGMAAMARTAGDLFVVVKVAGAAYLVWQGVRYWQTSPAAVAAQPSGHETLFWRNYGAGLLLMAGHAQAMLFYAALLPGFVDLAAITPRDFALIVVMLIVVIGGINAAYAYAAASARRLVSSAPAQRTIHRLAGVLMWLAAALVLSR